MGGVGCYDEEDEPLGDDEEDDDDKDKVSTQSISLTTFLLSKTKGFCFVLQLQWIVHI